MITLGKLEEITDLRSVWSHEALEFTPWLANEENLSILADTLGIEIALEETESSIGDFSVDILAKEVGTDKSIIIENQLEDTNHDHLGKLITYASGKNASYIIWIVKRAREEHKSAIEWLNNHTDDSVAFFLVEVKLYKIGNSDPAPKFEVIEEPNNWAKEVRKLNSNVGDIYGETQLHRLEYWTAFNNYAFENDLFRREFKKRKPSTNHWMSLYIGNSECHLEILQLKVRSSLGVQFWINDNKELFKTLEEHKTDINREVGAELVWDELPGKKASSISIEKKYDTYNKDDWNNQFEWIMSVLIKMKKAFKKYL